MNNQNDLSKPADSAETPKIQESECGPGCACNAGEPSGWMRWAVVVIVIAAATVLVAKGIVKNKAGSCCPVAGGFRDVTAPVHAPLTVAAVASSNQVAVKEISALSDLNTVALEMAGVFVYLPGTNAATDKVPTMQIEAAVRTIEPQAGRKIGVFALKAGTPDYIQVTANVAVPGVLAMVKGRGSAPVSGEITEVKLVQAFVAASSSGGCGAGGCGPGGCK